MVIIGQPEVGVSQDGAEHVSMSRAWGLTVRHLGRSVDTRGGKRVNDNNNGNLTRINYSGVLFVSLLLSINKVTRWLWLSLSTFVPLTKIKQSQLKISLTSINNHEFHHSRHHHYLHLSGCPRSCSKKKKLRQITTQTDRSQITPWSHPPSFPIPSWHHSSSSWRCSLSYPSPIPSWLEKNDGSHEDHFPNSRHHFRDVGKAVGCWVCQDVGCWGHLQTFKVHQVHLMTVIN